MDSKFTKSRSNSRSGSQSDHLPPTANSRVYRTTFLRRLNAPDTSLLNFEALNVRVLYCTMMDRRGSRLLTRLIEEKTHGSHVAVCRDIISSYSVGVRVQNF